MCPHTFLEPVSHNSPTVDAVKISTNQFESILNIQQSVLDSIAQDQKESEILDQLCTLSETLLENSAASIMLLNRKVNALEMISAPSIDEVSQQRFQGLIPGQYNGSCPAAIHFNKAIYVVDTFNDIRWKDGRELAKDFNICSCWSMPVFNRDGTVMGTFALSSFEHRSPTTFHDRLLKMCSSAVSILLERKKLRRLAMIDKLTGLWNRVKLDKELAAQNNNMTEPNYSYSIMLIDIDLFKSINDTYGHNVGDSVLKELSNILAGEVANEGLVGRWGGEEFMVILPKDSANKAPEIAQKIRQAIQQHIFKTVGQVTVSIGVCVVAHQTRTLEVIDEADQALYQAKKLGRNRVSVHYKNKPLSQSNTHLISEMVGA